MLTRAIEITLTEAEMLESAIDSWMRSHRFDWGDKTFTDERLAKYQAILDRVTAVTRELELLPDSETREPKS